MSVRRDWMRSVLAVALSALLGMGSVPATVALAWDDMASREAAATVEASVPRNDVALVATAEGPKEVGKLEIGKNATNLPASNLPILKDAGFDFVNALLPIQCWTDTDGTDVFAVGIDHTNTALWKDILSGKANVWNQALDKFNKSAKDNKFGFKPIFSVSALHRNDKKGKEWGEAAVLGGLAGQKQGQYFIFTGEVSFTGLLGVKVPFSYSTKDGAKLGGARLNLGGSFSPKIAGGVGIKYLGRFGVYGTGTISTEGTVLPKEDAGWNYVRLNAALGLEVVALIWRVWHKDLWHTKDIDLITPRPSIKGQSEDGAMGPYLEPQASQDLVFVPIVAQSADNGWDGASPVYVDAPYLPDRPGAPTGSGDTYDSTEMTNESSTPQRGMRLLQRNVYPDAQVELVEVPGGAVMCWLESTSKDASRPNSTRLMWSRYTAANDTWSEPALVCTAPSTATADFEPDLFADGEGNVHAAWLNAEREIPSGVKEMKDVTGLLNVSYARLDAGASAFSAPEVVEAADATSAYLRTSPEVAAVGGNVVVGWSTTRVDHMLDYGSDHKVVVCKGSPSGKGHTWSSKAYDYASSHEVTSLDAGMLGEEPAVAWTTDDLAMTAEGDVTNGTASSELRCATFSDAASEARLVSGKASNADFCMEGGRGALTWTEPGVEDSDNLCAIDSAGGSRRLLKSDAMLPPNYQVDGDLTRSALITYPMWEGADTAEKSTTDIYGRVLTQGTQLSDEALLVSHADDLTSHDVAFVGGAPLVACAAERGVGGGQTVVGDGLVAQATEARSADLLVARADSLERLSVTDLLYEVEGVRPGAVVEMYVSVSNEGLDTIDGGVCAKIIDDRTGAVLGSGTYAAPIGVGEDAKIPVTVRVPADFDPRACRDISVKANFEGAQAKDSTALNLDTALIGQDYDNDYVPASPGGWSPTPTYPAGYQGVPSYAGVSYGGGSHSGGSYSGGSYSGGASGTSASSGTASGRVVRKSGADRYETMAATVSSAFSSSEWAVVASGEGFADALCALSLAGLHDAPVILTAPGALSGQAKEELERLGCKHVLVAGGEAAVSEAVASELVSLVGDVRRMAGADRYETSLALLREVRSTGAPSDTVFVATGTGFADALSAGPVSWKLGAPVVLTGPDGTLPAAAVAAIKADAGIRRIVLLGGTAAVSDAVRGQLGDGYAFERLGGADRYETSLAIARWASSHGLGWTSPSIATGRGFADALAGAAVAGKASSCLLLADDSSTHALAGLKENASAVRGVWILGGAQAVSASVERQVANALA